jgi:hypothetical protein
LNRKTIWTPENMERLEKETIEMHVDKESYYNAVCRGFERLLQRKLKRKGIKTEVSSNFFHKNLNRKLPEICCYPITDSSFEQTLPDMFVKKEGDNFKEITKTLPQIELALNLTVEYKDKRIEHQFPYLIHQRSSVYTHDGEIKEGLGPDNETGLMLLFSKGYDVLPKGLDQKLYEFIKSLDSSNKK